MSAPRLRDTRARVVASIILMAFAMLFFAGFASASEDTEATWGANACARDGR